MHFKQGGDIVGLPSPRPLPRSPHRGRDALHEGEGGRKLLSCKQSPDDRMTILRSAAK